MWQFRKRNYKGEYAIKSFNPFSVYWLKKHYPEIVRGQLASNFKNEKMNVIKKIVLKNMLLNFIARPDFVSYGIDGLPNKRVAKYRKTNIVLGWTITDYTQMEKGRKYCDNLICENLEKIDKNRKML